MNDKAAQIDRAGPTPTVWDSIEEDRRHFQATFAQEQPQGLALLNSLLIALEHDLDRLDRGLLDAEGAIAGAFLSAGVVAFTHAAVTLRDGFPLQAFPSLRLVIECVSIVSGLAAAPSERRAQIVTRLLEQVSNFIDTSEQAYDPDILRDTIIESAAFRVILVDTGNPELAAVQQTWLEYLHNFSHPGAASVSPYYREGGLASPEEAARRLAPSTLHSLFAVGLELLQAVSTLRDAATPESKDIRGLQDQIAAWSEQQMPQGAIIPEGNWAALREGWKKHTGDPPRLGKGARTVTTTLEQIAAEGRVLTAEELLLIQRMRSALDQIALRSEPNS